MASLCSRYLALFSSRMLSLVPMSPLVVLLVEQPLSEQDARQVRGLHEEIEEHVRYHLLLPNRLDDDDGDLRVGFGLRRHRRLRHHRCCCHHRTFCGYFVP